MNNCVELEIYDNRVFRGIKLNKNRFFLVHTVIGSVRNPIEVKLVDLTSMKVIVKPYKMFTDQIHRGLLVWMDEICPNCNVLHSHQESAGRYCLNCKLKNKV